MRARPLTLLTALAAVTLVVVAGCEARVEAEAYSAADRISSRPQARPQPQPVELLLRAITPPRAPAASPNVGFGELPTRVRRATDEAAAMGATLSVAVLDRATGQLVSNGNTQIIATASVAKLFIADDLLLAEAEGKVTLSPEDHHALDVMLQSSDDGAAERFWSQDGGNAVVTQVARRYGLRSTAPPSDGRWWNTISSAPDLIRYYDMLLDGSGGLPLDRAAVIIADLAQSTPTGIDGYPQRSASPTVCTPNRSQSNRAGCAVSAAAGCICPPG